MNGYQLSFYHGETARKQYLAGGPGKMPAKVKLNSSVRRKIQETLAKKARASLIDKCETWKLDLTKDFV